MGTKDPRVDAYIAKSADFAKPILTHLREIVHTACPAVEETIKWSMPTFMHNGIMCSMAAFKEHAALNLWKGSLILGVGGEQVSMGQFGKITKLADLPSKKVLTEYIRQAAALNEAGTARPKSPKPDGARKRVPTAPPADFAAALGKHAKARTTFAALSPSQKREYVEWIVDAKRDETRQRRLAQAVEMLAEGKTRNWKYS